jgi:hypothetical protein
VLRRKSEVVTEPVPLPEESHQGKGRPTPKRREAQAGRRKRAVAPRDRKEAVRQQRQQAREARMRAREAMLSGDERHLPARDRGPVRRFSRDYVDARRSAGELFLPGLLIVLMLSLVPALRASASTAQLLIFALLIVDSVVLGVRLRGQLKRRFPDESRSGTTVYAILRSMQIRRWRMPKPRVKPGTKL